MSIRSWLKKNGYLSEENDKDKGKKSTIVTSKGTEVGIKSELRKDSRGVDYMYISYGREAQELIVANMDKIL